MDITSYLQCFESSLTSYTGDDPLEPWVKFVEHLEQRLPAGGGSGMSLVFDRLVQRFLSVERYTNDIRYVNYCIKCASYYSDPIALYSHFFSKGIGTRTAALYVAWAQQFEHRGMKEQADAVYQKALENQAHPANIVLHEYRQFQTRTRSETAMSVNEMGSRNPLQNSNLTNQMSHREPVTQNKQVPVDCQSSCGPANKVVITVSRSETSGSSLSSQSSSVQTVAEYTKEELICEGSELCFEEVRAQTYFRKLREREREEREMRRKREEREMLREREEREMLREREENEMRREREREEREVRREREEREMLQETEEREMLQEREEREMLQEREEREMLQEREEREEREMLQEREEREMLREREERERETEEREMLQETEEREMLQEREENEMRREREESEEKDLSTIIPSKTEESCKWFLEKVHHVLENQGGLTRQMSSQRLPVAETANSVSLGLSQPAFGRPPPSNRLSSRRSLGLRLHSEPTFIREAAAVAEPPHQQRIDGTANILSSEVSHRPSVLADRSAGLQKSAVSSVPTDQESVLQVSAVQPTTDLPLHRAACSTAVSADVLSSSDSCPPLELNATHQHAGQPAELQEKLDVSQGATANLSHITPNNSLGFVQATPSRVLPSPTVNTREALGVIMDMFQAPTFLEEPFSSTSVLHAAEKESDAGLWTDGGASSFPKPPTTPAFTIFQDDNDKENGSAAAPAAAERSKAGRALAEISLSKADKPNETPPDLIPDESTMWGARYNSLNSLAACPNSTSDFAMLAQFASTPFTHKAFFSGDFFEDQENKCDDHEADDDAYTRRQTKKLSPILEQSPSDEKLSETAISQLVPSSARQGTIVGEGLAMAQHCLTTSSITMVQPPPPTVLSFRDQTLCPADPYRTAGPGWEVYTSPEQPTKQASFISVRPKSEPFKIMEDLEKPASSQVQNRVCDVPMSPECAPRPDWLAVRSPEATVEPDLDAFLSPHHSRNLDVPMSPEQPQLCADVPMSPTPISSVDEPMMSPDRGLRPGADMSMNADTPQTAPAGAVQLVSDPWDTELISGLLSGLSPPLTAHPRCTTWQCNIPNITPKMTISMGKQSLRVDCILGEGAFATVYQATNPVTLEKMVLKVQKPANPWEFYINTQLDARLQPDMRLLYSSMHSAHLFHDGSVLLGELHSYGTLLNAVNMYKTLSDKVMPQPLVMYFTICILHMVEQLHSVRIVHADIKPDNFLLGERFLENKCFDLESTGHGLVLVDLGQSIDMELFPEGTAFTAKCLTSGFQCTEMLSGKPWNYQTDYFGIAGTVYCMLFGTYMQVTNEGGVWKTNAVFRRNPHSDLWLELFHTLLNVPDCGSPPSLRSLRCRLAALLQDTYSSKLASLKSRLVVLLLENRKAARR